MGLWALQICKSMINIRVGLIYILKRRDKVQKAETETSARPSKTVIFLFFFVINRERKTSPYIKATAVRRVSFVFIKANLDRQVTVCKQTGGNHGSRVLRILAQAKFFNLKKI